MTDSLPSLTYFDMRGRVEAVRLLCVDRGFAFRDRRIRSQQNWETLSKMLTLRVLPHFHDDAVSINQSQAILRYLARSVGVMPADPVAQAPYDEAQFALAEVQEILWQFGWQEDYARDPEPFLQHELHELLRDLERLYLRGVSEFWVGERASHVDFLAFALFDELRAFFPDALARFPTFVQFHSLISSRPNVRAYIDSTRRPAVFGMALHGPKIDPLARVEPGTLFESPWSEPVDLAEHVNDLEVLNTQIALRAGAVETDNA
ncbi:MAG: glutathione S-transferase family protein [Pseudomonadota bacterium]